MSEKSVQPGQRFKSDTGSVWEVLRLLNLAKVPKHVVIVDVHDRSASKMISESVLFEQHRFYPVR